MLKQRPDQERPRIYLLSDRDTVKLSKQGDGLSPFLCSLVQSLGLQEGKRAREREKNKDAIVVVQAKNAKGLCQSRESRNAVGECIQNISVSERKSRSLVTD